MNLGYIFAFDQSVLCVACVDLRPVDVTSLRKSHIHASALKSMSSDSLSFPSFFSLDDLPVCMVHLNGCL